MCIPNLIWFTAIVSFGGAFGLLAGYLIGEGIFKLGTMAACRESRKAIRAQSQVDL